MLSVLRAESPARGERAQKYGNRGRPVTRSSGGGFPDNWDSLEEGIVRVSGSSRGCTPYRGLQVAAHGSIWDVELQKAWNTHLNP